MCERSPSTTVTSTSSIPFQEITFFQNKIEDLESLVKAREINTSSSIKAFGPRLMQKHLFFTNKKLILILFFFLYAPKYSCIQKE